MHATAASEDPRTLPASLILFVGAGCRPGVHERATLGRGGLRCLWVADTGQARGAARLARFDAVVVDADALGPRFGLALVRLRDALACPVVVVAAPLEGADGMADELDEILALELGADVYLHRPVLPARLLAHLGVLLRRGAAPRLSPAAADAAPAVHAHQRWAASLAAVASNGTQAALLRCLTAAQGRIVTRAELLAALPAGQALGARGLDVHMHRLRRRLAAAGTAGPCIGAVRGVGYILTAAAAGPAPNLRVAA